MIGGVFFTAQALLHTYFSAMMSQHYMGLSLQKATGRFSPTFLGALCKLAQVNLNVMSLCAQIIESLKCLWYKRNGEIVLELIEAHLHQFLLDEFCGYSKVTPLHRAVSR